MADHDHSPKLAALKSLEASLEAHWRNQAPPATAPQFPSARAALGQWLQRACQMLFGALCAMARRRWVRRAAILMGGLLLVAASGIGALWWRLASGPIALDFATPWLAAAIEENLGRQYRVELGGTVFERDEYGRPALRLRDIIVRDQDGVAVASAPRAEVGLSKISLFAGRPRAQRLNLVGAELSVRIEPAGNITISTAAAKRPIATAPMLAPAEGRPTVSPDRGGAGSVPRNGIEDLAALLAWVDNLGRLGLDGHDLMEVGLKNGRLIIEDLRNGRQTRLDHIDLSLTRPHAGEVVLRLGSDQPEGAWALLAGVKSLGRGKRALSIEARRLSVHDLLLALRIGDAPVQGDLPLSASVRAEIGPQGIPESARGRFLLGPGSIADPKDPDAAIAIDRGELNFEWDAEQGRFAAPFQIISGGNRLTLMALAEAPREAGAPWTVGLRGGSIVLAPLAPDQRPLQITRIVARGRYDTVKRRLELEQADFGGEGVSIAASGSLEFSGPEPRLVMGLAGRKMTVAAFKQVWPVFINPAVRTWVRDHFLNGEVERIEIATNAPLSAFKASGPPVPDDGLSIEIVTSRATVQPVAGLPAIRDAELVTHVAGKTVRLTLGRGVVDLPSGRRLTISDGVFEIPNSQIAKPPARARARIEGPVPAAAELLAMERLREASGAPLDPATSRGNVTAQVGLAMPIDPALPKGRIDYDITADVTNFALDRFMGVQRVEAQSLRITANPQGYLVKGDVRVAGTPASIDYRKPRGEAEAELRLQANFDDAARSRFGFDFAGALTGPVPIKLGGKIAAAGDQESRFAIEADLTQAKIDNLMPGWIKLPGKTVRASFTMSTRAGRPTRIEDLVIEGAGTLVKGTLEVDANNEIIAAHFPIFALSDGDKVTLKAERHGDGVLKVTMRGDVYDGRGFIKSVFGGGPKEGKARGIPDLDLDIKIGAVAGFQGEALRGLELRLSRRGGHLASLSLSAKHGIDAPLKGELRARSGGRQVVYIESADAGALFRFTDTYARMYGGQMWIVMDPPTLDHAPQEGLLNIRNFVIRGEAALERVVAGAPGEPRGGVEFSRMQVDFVRSPGKLTIKDGVVRGPIVGATLDGVLDYAANNIRMRGTFVPLYGLNNMFGQIPIVGLFLGGGSNEGLVGLTFEVVGPPGAPRLNVNPISMVAPGLLRKVFEFPSSVPGERYADPRSSYADR